MVDGDDEQAVDNMPTNNRNNDECACGNWSGNTPGFCARKSLGRRKENSTLIEPCENRKLDCFLRFVPKQWIENTVVPEISKF